MSLRKSLSKSRPFPRIRRARRPKGRQRKIPIETDLARQFAFSCSVAMSSYLARAEHLPIDEIRSPFSNKGWAGRIGLPFWRGAAVSREAGRAL